MRAFLLPDGRAFFLGGNGHTALYTPTGTTTPGSWAAGTDIPNGYGITGRRSGHDAQWQNPLRRRLRDQLQWAHVLLRVRSRGRHLHLGERADRRLGQICALPNQYARAAGWDHPLLEVQRQLYVYTPDGTPLAAGKPTITGITQNADASFHLTGTLLNGISEGAAYGDDGQMATNYPIVRLTNSGGTVYTARAFGRSSTSIMTGSAAMSTEFYLPRAFRQGLIP